MDFTLDYLDFTLDYTEIRASDWSEAQSAQSRAITFRRILIRDACVLSWGNLDLGTLDCKSRDNIRLLAPLLQNILEFTEPILVLF